KWPGTSRPIRVEAAAWRGKPVVFAVLGPWSRPERLPAPGSQEEDVRGLVLAIVAIVVLAGAALLTRIHLAKGRSDWRGALRLATFMFCVEIALWAARSHFNLSLGTLGMFFIAIGTSVYYGVIVWTVYLALEPYIRRYWPQTIISWTRVLSGRISDPIVGRDVLIGAAVSLCWRAVGHANFFSRGPGAVPSLVSTDLLLGLRSSIGEYLEVVPHAIRETLVIFFLLFLLRVVLRNQWLGALAFAIIFTAMAAYNAGIFQLLATFAIYASIATVILRFGLLALASAIFIDGIIGDVPVTSDPSVWYFGIFACVTIGVIALLTWAFRESIAGQKLFPEDLLG
ncbi:MAG: hypothetical protein H7Y20_01980, partial [Bryobacteraceae bacterium]|nr:hypothetical protein [Bryobacteraceae bacterium]